MKAGLLLDTLKRMTEHGYAVVDLETTGLDPARCEIAEIGCLFWSPDMTAEPGPKSWLVRCTTTPESEKITGITQAMIDSDGLDVDDAILELARYIGNRKGPALDLRIVGHNYLRYDADVFAHAQPASLRSRAFARQEIVIDTAALFKGGRLGWGMEDGESLLDYQMRVLNERVFGLKYSLAYVCDELDIKHDDIQAHRAVGDIVMTFRIFQKIVEKLEAYEAKKKALA